MSNLNKLTIQGLRSYDPNNPQIVEFFNPVTLILGQNGSGKTTIIEALKYATTGDMPPGAKVGGGFVHDPKIAKEIDVKAKVTLEMHDVKGIEMSVSRALKAIIKGGETRAISTQTLDSSIKRSAGVNKESISISSKCADIDYEVTNSLGVAKAVLDSVIFCHQEESNWPLTEGKAVKQRFDDLFASARYVKVLDTIRKTKVDKDNSIKQMKGELKYLKIDRDDAKKKSEECTDLTYDIMKMRQKAEELTDTIKPIEAELEQYHSKLEEIYKIEQELQMKSREKLSYETRIQELRVTLSGPITSTMEELSFKFQNYMTNTDKIKASIDENQARIDSLRREIATLENSNGDCLVRKGSLQIKMENLRSNKTKFTSSVERLANQHGIEYVADNASGMLSQFRDRLSAMDNELNEHKTRYEALLSDKQSQIDDLVSRKASVAQQAASIDSQMKHQKHDLVKLEQSLNDIAKNSSKLDQVCKNSQELKDALAHLKENFNMEASRSSIQQIRDVIKDEERELDIINEELSKCQSQEAKYNELQQYQQQRSEKQTNYRRLRLRHGESLSLLFPGENLPELGLRNKLHDAIGILREKSRNCHNNHTRYQQQLSNVQMELRDLRSKISDSRVRINQYEDTLARTGYSSLGELREARQTLSVEVATMRGSRGVYDSFLGQLRGGAGCNACPLCHQDLHGGPSDLIEEITEKLASMPTVLDRKSTQLEHINGQFEELLKYESVLDEIDRDRVQLPNMESQVEVKTNEIKSINEMIMKSSKEKENLADLEMKASMIQGDVAVMEKLQEEIDQLTRLIGDGGNPLSNTQAIEDFMQQLDGLKKRKVTTHSHLQEQKKTLDAQNTEYEKMVSRENMLISQINKLESERLNLQESNNQRTSLEQQRDQLSQTIKGLAVQHADISLQMAPINEQLLKARDSLDQERRHTTLLYNQLRDKNESFKSAIVELDKMLIALSKYEQENLSGQMDELERQRLTNDNTIAQFNTQINQFNNCIEELKSQVNMEKVAKREIQDSISILRYETNLMRITADLSNIQLQLTDQSSDSLRASQMQLQQQYAAVKREMDAIDTGITQRETKRTYIETDLKDRFTGIEEKYMNHIYKMKTTELACQDLEKYYRALDRSIMSYHHSKMAEINKILKELWRTTYSGKDIDFIEICSEDNTSGASGRRRTYNYRVVMFKSTASKTGNAQTTRLDMRGRCSAGQKVLASLLIRLALAEVFCINCGVLALDEPTTNLDRDNIENLAYALVQIIKTRCNQKNFQLIIITHDEDFVQLLGRSDYVDQFYKVSCDAKGFSKVDKIGIDSRV